MVLLGEQPVTEVAGHVVPRWQRPGFIAVTLGVLYVLGAWLTMANGYLSTDVGGKTATLQAMVDRGDWSPDIGYWAADLDPDGSLHPFFGTTEREGGTWTNVTSLPMVLAARPLYAVGGFPLTLLLPMVGSIAAALGAGALEREWRGGRPLPLGWRSAWIIGVGSPMAVYALDLWEHSLGVAFMVWGYVALARSMRSGAVAQAALSGLWFGVAASMRQEALVFGFVAGAVLLWRFRTRFWTPAAMAAGTIGALALNTMVDRQLFGSAARVERSVGVFDGVGAEFATRLAEGAVTLGSPIPSVDHGAIGIGLLVFGVLFWLGLASARGQAIRRPALLAAGLCVPVLLRLAITGPAFMPGLVAALPLAGIGFGAMAARAPRRYLVLALAPLPLVWFVQYLGGAPAQWGGRYVLVAGVLGAVGAVVWLGNAKLLRAGALVGLALTLVGVTWLGIRGAAVEEAADQLVALDAPVVVFHSGFMARETGPAMLGQRWLSAHDVADQLEAAALLTEAGYVRSAWIVPEGDPPPDLGPEWSVAEAGEVRWGDLSTTDVYFYQR